MSKAMKTTAVIYDGLLAKIMHPAILVGIAVALVAGGYAVGRYEAPTKTIVTEKVVTVEHQVIVTQTKTEIKVVYVKVKEKVTHETSTTTKKPDGTETTTTTKDTNTKTQTSTQADTKTDSKTKSETDKSQTTEKQTVTVRDRPQWSTGLGIGFSIPEALDKTPGYHLIDRLGPIILQGEIDRRLFGPFSAGIWGTTSGVLGLKVRLDF